MTSKERNRVWLEFNCTVSEPNSGHIAEAFCRKTLHLQWGNTLQECYPIDLTYGIMARKIASQSTKGRTAAKRWVWRFIAVGTFAAVALLGVRHWVKLSAPAFMAAGE
jgi:hypothetical protein